MKVITISYANCVESVVILNDDVDVEKLTERLKEEAAKTEDGAELHIQAVTPNTFDEAIDYITHI